MESFTTTQIKMSLTALGIPFESNEIELDRLQFKSFRRIEPHGIYYAEGRSDAGIRESLVLCADTTGFDGSNCLVRLSHPQLAFYKLMRHFHGKAGSAGVPASAIVAPGAVIAPGVEIGPYCVIGKAVLQAGVKLSSHVVVADNCILGENTVVEPHSTIGASGVAWVWDVETGERIVQPQIGGVVIGKNCFLGSDVSIVRGSVNEDTVVGDGTVIAHGTKVGRVAAAQLQGDRVFQVVVAQVALDVAVDLGAGGHHLGVEPGMTGNLAMEHAAVAVGPVHHGCYAECSLSILH